MGLQIKFNGITGKFDLVQNVSTLVPQTRTLTINGVTYDLSSNRTWTVSATDNSYKKSFLLGGM